MTATKPPPTPGATVPLIPDSFIDVPTQRLWYLGLGGIFQAIKIFDFVRYSFGENALCRKWLFVDFAYVAVLAQLRIPRLHYSKAVVLLQIMSLWFLDGLMFGGINVNLSGGLSGGLSLGGSSAEYSTTSESFRITDFLSSLTLGLITSSESSASDAHLLGQHTIRMSPISTAQLNPNAMTFCLPQHGSPILIPVLLNNTNPSILRYSVSPLGPAQEEKRGEVERFDLTMKDIKAIEQARLEGLQVARPSSSNSGADEYDEYDDDEEPALDSQRSHNTLQKTQSLVHIRITRPGTVRLERVLDVSNAEARLGYPSQLTIVPCPRVQFVEEERPQDDTRCLGQDPDVQLMIDISGVAPLSLRWFKTINGRRESYLVEGIEGQQDDPAASDPSQQQLVVRSKGVPVKLRVPLAVSLDAAGSHQYALEEVTDAVGNVVPVDGMKAPSTSRSFQVLRRPAVSFKHCGPGNPTSILLDSETPLTISTNEVDPLDGPLDVVLKYHPPTNSENEDRGNKRFKAWKKTLKTQANRRDLTVRASAPGQYTIASVKGKWCTGDVLAPETCQVVERPLPSAEIEWKRIHECSGDTGVSAALVLRGTPPFQVYYRSQRDNETPRDASKTFPTSRGELTLQPESSGHYTFTFVQISDAHYKKVELSGPSIDQVIHPLAAADFAGGRSGKKRSVSSCEGNTIDIDVDLKGTGPWNLEVQVVGPKSSETLHFPDIEESRKTLQIPIPAKIDQEGGSFEIDLVSVEDKYKCKRSISVPGISVNVRRIKPTVKFYGDIEQRHINILENEPARLPLRLTGDGPWRIKYRRKENENRIYTSTLKTPNDHLEVTENGIYEIIGITDSQCPGSVIVDSSTYRVDWIARPSAKLSSQTRATYEAYNNSHILPPICEGVDDHVDLDLIGRPPFQIMYNIGQPKPDGLRGTDIIDQPTFNSIQPRTRLQLKTSPPGRVYYEVKQIGDASYPLAKHKNAVIPIPERLLFEQQVSMRPSARFKTRGRMSYCLNDAFVPLDFLSSDGVVLFEGTPPFQLRMSIRNLASSQTDSITIETSDYAWKIDLPSYEFKSIGPHHIIIESVSDSSSCAHAALDPLATSVWADVAETAAIVPFDRREDFCVGDVAQFQLEGIPPWTIGYRINNKAHTQEAKVSPFSLVQQQPGEFRVTSIAHQQKLCKAVVTDLKFAVHSLPSAQVGHGKRVYQDLHEGDQAEIVFTLIGEPPFTFTYQRSEPSVKRGGKPGKVLETHTVSRVFSKEYSIYSALEGTWTVTSISDKYCRYPAQPDVGVEKQRP